MTSGIPARDPLVLTNGQITNIWLLFFERLYTLYVQTDVSNSEALEGIRTIALSAKSIAEQAQLTNTTQAQQINDIVDQIAVLDDTKANKADLQPIEDTANDAKALVLELQQDMLGLQSQINSILAKNYDTKIAQLSNQILTVVTQLSDLYTVKADKVTQIIAGDGLTGGGDLSADRTITLGTPSTITSATTNSVSGTTHIHALDTTGVTAGTYGNSVQVASITFDDKGRATTASSVDIRVSTTSATGIVQLATNAEAQALTDAAKAITPATLSATATSTNTASRIVIRDASGNFAAGTITAALIGNATTATTWQTGRAITIGSTGKTVDGSANVSWSLAEIGALPSTGGTLTGDLTLNADPTSALHAVTKQYVDNLAAGIDAKDSVKAATTANITLSGTQTIDGVALVATNRVLVKNQSTVSQNGLYSVSAGSWTRTTDADTWNELIGAHVFVEQGTINADTGWVCTVDSGGTLGTTNVTWTQYSGVGAITGGTGITVTGNQISITNTTVTPGTYGSSTTVPVTTYNAQGQATGSTSTDIAFPVTTVFGRPGNVTATAGDYTATQITNTPAGNIAATTVQTAINELDTEKQANLASSTSVTLSGNQLQSAAKTGDVTAPANSNAMTIAANAVTLGKMATVATATVFYRKTAGTGDPEVQTLATLKTDLGLTGTNSGDQTITLTGDVTGTGTGSFAATLGNNVVTNPKAADMAANTLKGNATNATADPADIALAANQFLARASTGDIAAKAITDFGLSLVDDTTASAARTTLGLGTAATQNTGTSGANIPLLNVSNTWSGTQTVSNAAVAIEVNSDTAATGAQYIARRSRVGPAAIQSGDVIASYFFGGYEGSTYINTVQLGVYATENYSATNGGSEIRFATVLTGSAPNTRTNRWGIDGTAAFRPYQDNTLNFGSSSFRVKEIFCGNATINTSDAREKTVVTALTQQELSCAVALAGEIGWFKWLAAVEEKGNAARKHIGLTVQRVIEVMQAHQLNPFDYSFVCYDQWDAVYEPVIALRSVDNGDGTFSSEEYQTDEMKCVREAGDRYSLRDGEFNKFLLAGLWATFEARLSALESANL